MSATVKWSSALFQIDDEHLGLGMSGPVASTANLHILIVAFALATVNVQPNQIYWESPEPAPSQTQTQLQPTSTSGS